jgi:hypothetical protein
MHRLLPASRAGRPLVAQRAVICSVEATVRTYGSAHGCASQANPSLPLSTLFRWSVQVLQSKSGSSAGFPVRRDTVGPAAFEQCHRVQGRRLHRRHLPDRKRREWDHVRWPRRSAGDAIGLLCGEPSVSPSTTSLPDRARPVTADDQVELVALEPRGGAGRGGGLRITGDQSRDIRGRCSAEAPIQDGLQRLKGGQPSHDRDSA